MNNYNPRGGYSIDEREDPRHGQSLDRNEATRGIVFHDIIDTLARQRLTNEPRNETRPEEAPGSAPETDPGHQNNNERNVPDDIPTSPLFSSEPKETPSSIAVPMPELNKTLRTVPQAPTTLTPSAPQPPIPSPLVHKPPAQLQQSSSEVPPSVPQSAVPQAAPSAHQAPVPSTSGGAEPVVEDLELELGAHGPHSTITATDISDLSLTSATSVNSGSTEQSEEELQIRKTRQDEKAKDLTPDQKDFVLKIIHHVNNFMDDELITIYLEPLVALNQDSNRFEPHFHMATNRNTLCLAELMNNPDFKGILEMGQPKFVSLAKQYLEKFKHNITPKGKGDKHQDKKT